MSFDRYYNYVMENKAVKYKVVFEPLPLVSAEHKWVGAQYAGKNVYGIPNDMNAILRYTEKSCVYFGELGNGLFKWTGGCLWNNFLYAFPRTSSSILKMSLETENIGFIESEKKYTAEHHYGGVCTREGVVYQPPRDSNHILVWNLKTEESRKIYLTSESDCKIFRYCGSILHPNGYIYFLPERGEKIIKLNIKDESWRFIGEKIDAMVFDAKVAVDKNIYGFSAYCNGLLKVHVDEDYAEMIHDEIAPGAYGTKLGVNGHLYSVPGDGSQVWDFDPITNSIESIYQFSFDAKAKYAGGVTLKNGDIYAVPARENQLFQLRADEAGIEIPNDIYQDFFVDEY